MISKWSSGNGRVIPIPSLCRGKNAYHMVISYTLLFQAFTKRAWKIGEEYEDLGSGDKI